MIEQKLVKLKSIGDSDQGIIKFWRQYKQLELDDCASEIIIRFVKKMPEFRKLILSDHFSIEELSKISIAMLKPKRALEFRSTDEKKILAVANALGVGNHLILPMVFDSELMRKKEQRTPPLFEDSQGNTFAIIFPEKKWTIQINKIPQSSLSENLIDPNILEQVENLHKQLKKLKESKSANFNDGFKTFEELYTLWCDIDTRGCEETAIARIKLLSERYPTISKSLNPKEKLLELFKCACLKYNKTAPNFIEENTRLELNKKETQQEKLNEPKNDEPSENSEISSLRVLSVTIV